MTARKIQNSGGDGLKNVSPLIIKIMGASQAVEAFSHSKLQNNS